MFQTSLGLRYTSRASGCVAGEGNHQREQPCGATVQGFDTLQPRASIVGWNPVRPNPSSQMYIMIKLGKSATKAIAASKSPSAKLTVHPSKWLELFSYVHDAPYTHGFSSIILAPHAKGIPEWIWKAICRFNEKPHQRKRISSLPISGAFVGLFYNYFFSWLAIHRKNDPKYYSKTFGICILL